MVQVLRKKFECFFNNRWLVLVCSMWVMSCSGVGYLFGSISPVIKSALGYNQRQVAALGVAKDLGDAIGFVAGSLCEVLPMWAIMIIGVLQNFVGYGLVWLVVTQRLPSLPLWLLCVAVFVGTNGETYFTTGALVSSVQNFPKSRGPVVGILKGFAGLSGAILTQIYAILNAPNEASLVFMIAVGPSMVVIALMFIVRPVGGYKQVRQTDSSSFSFIYSVCVILAAYLLAVLILEDLVKLNETLIAIFSVILIVLILLPIIVPMVLVFFSEPRLPAKESLLPSSEKPKVVEIKQEQNGSEVILSEVEDEKTTEVDSLPAPERHKRIAHLQAKLFQATAEGAVRVKRRKGPRRGEDFTLLQALVKADFLLLFLSLVLASGSGLTVIDNLGQICQSLGYKDASIFVSMISIWNFLGRVGGGYFSEVIIRNFAYPRPVAMAVAQVVMAIGLLYFTMGWPGQVYVVSILIGLGYGAHWGIVPASASELFGLKSFGALYNFLALSSPAGSLIFSGVIASSIYDHYAEEQAAFQKLNFRSVLATHLQEEESLTCVGSICYSLTCGIMSGLCIIAMILSLIVVHRTKGVYAQLYGKTIA
uniref:Uncharacterized protein n=1 Tax=Rhizophora mucronata TaxID=61149 RepID=A0A2P2KTK2_RHIMU